MLDPNWKICDGKNIIYLVDLCDCDGTVANDPSYVFHADNTERRDGNLPPG